MATQPPLRTISSTNCRGVERSPPDHTRAVVPRRSSRALRTMRPVMCWVSTSGNDSEYRSRNKGRLNMIAYRSVTALFLVAGWMTSVSAEEVRLYGTQVHEIYSSIHDETYKLFVHLPPTYEESETSYPVLYMTDADLLFGVAANVARLSQLRGDLPDFIIVGIAYGVYETDARNHRNRDFLAAVPDDGDWHPGAADFLRFLETQVFTFVDSSFRTDPSDRAIWGTSFGANFGIYALFRTDRPFGRFVVSSPATAWANRWAFEYESTYASLHDSLEARVFFSVGELEHREWMVDPFNDFVDVVVQREYRGLSMTRVVEPGEWHQSMPGAVFARSLKFIYGQ